MEEERHLKNWHRDTPNAPVMPYNTLIHAKAPMTVAEWIEKLKEFPLDQEVRITDGHKYHFYEGHFEFSLFEDIDGSTFVDIGIGGYDEDEE